MYLEDNNQTYSHHVHLYSSYVLAHHIVEMSAPAPITTKTTNPVASTVSTKFLRPGKVVILLNGRHAGKKAFIVGPLDTQCK